MLPGRCGGNLGRQGVRLELAEGQQGRRQGAEELAAGEPVHVGGERGNPDQQVLIEEAAKLSALLVARRRSAERLVTTGGAT